MGTNYPGSVNERQPVNEIFFRMRLHGKICIPFAVLL